MDYEDLKRRLLEAMRHDGRVLLSAYEVRSAVEQDSPRTYDIKDIDAALELLQNAGRVHKLYIRQRQGHGDFHPVGWMLNPITEGRR